MAQPHDALFRAVFSRSEEVAAFLGLLAPELAEVRPEDLTPVPGTFIDEALQSRHTDALWRLAWRGRELLIYFLIESTRARWIAG